MKKPVLMAAMLAAASLSVSAQYTSKAPDGGFDFSKGKDYVILYAPADAVGKMGSKIASNQNLDPSQQKNSFQYWVADWDKKLLTLYNVEEEGGKNSYGTDEYLNMTPLYEWGSGQFHAFSPFKYDLSMLDDDYIMHIGLRDFGNASCQLNIQLLPDQKLGYKITVNAEQGAPVGDFVGVGNIAHDSQWYYLDIPLKDLNDPDGDFGFEPDFNTIGENVFVIGFNKPTNSKFKQGSVDPATGLYEINITELNSAASFDSVFFYKVDDAGVENVSADDEGISEYYDLYGRKITGNTHGIVIEKNASGSKKVIK